MSFSYSSSYSFSNSEEIENKSIIREESTNSATSEEKEVIESATAKDEGTDQYISINEKEGTSLSIESVDTNNTTQYDNVDTASTTLKVIEGTHSTTSDDNVDTKSTTPKEKVDSAAINSKEINDYFALNLIELTYENISEHFKLDNKTSSSTFNQLIESLQKFSTEQWYKTEYEHAIQLYQIIISFITKFKIKTEFKVETFYIKIGQIYSKIRSYDESLTYFTKAKVILEEANNKQELSSLYKLMARFYLKLRNYSSCLSYLNKEAACLDIESDTKEISLKRKHAEYYIRLANFYLKFGFKSECLKNLQKAELIIESNTKEFAEINAFFSKISGNYHLKFGTRNDCLKNYEDSYKYYSKNKNQEYEIDLLLKRGKAFLKFGEYNKCYEDYSSALKLIENVYIARQKIDGLIIHQRLAKCLSLMGVYYQHIGDFSNSFENLNNAHTIYLKLNRQNSAQHKDLVYSNRNLGYYHLSRADFAKSFVHFDIAHKINSSLYKQCAHNTTRKIGSNGQYLTINPEIASSFTDLTNYYLEIADYKKALETIEDAHSIYQIYFESNDKLNKIYHRGSSLTVHHLIAETFISYANVLLKLGKYEQSLLNYENSKAIFTELYSDDKLALDLHLEMAFLYQNLGHYYLQRGDYVSALLNYMKTRDIYQKYFNKINKLDEPIGLREDRKDYLLIIHPNVAQSLTNLGNYFLKRGDFKNAKQFFCDSIKINEEFFSEFLKQSILAINYSNYGDYFLKVGDFKNSLNYYKDAIKTFEECYIEALSQKIFIKEIEIFLVNHPNCADALFKLGDYYNQTGDFNNAYQSYNSSLEYIKSENDDHSAREAYCYRKLGYNSLASGDFEKSFEYFNKSKEIFQLYFHKEHLENWLDLDLAEYYYQLGDLNNALILLFKGLDVLRKFYENLNPNEYSSKRFSKYHSLNEQFKHCCHPDISSLFIRISLAYTKYDDASRGLEYAYESYAMNQALYDAFESSKQHLETAESLSAISLAYLKYGDAESALSFSSQAYLMFNDLLVHRNHPKICFTLNNYGLSLARFGNLNRGRAAVEISNEQYKAFYGSIHDHPDLINSLLSVGYLNLLSGDYKVALETFENAYLRAKVLFTNENHVVLASCLNYIGMSHVRAGNGFLALRSFRNALKMLQIVFKSNKTDVLQLITENEIYLKALDLLLDHPGIAFILNNIGSAYLRMGDYKNSLIYFEQSFKMYQFLYQIQLPDADFDNRLKRTDLAGLFDKRFIINHSQIVNVLNNIGSAYLQYGDAKKALEYFQQGLKMNEILFTNKLPFKETDQETINEVYLNLPLHVDLAVSLNNIGSAYVKVFNDKKAQDCFENSLRIYSSLVKKEQKLEILERKYEEEFIVPQILEDNNIDKIYYKEFTENNNDELSLEFHPEIAATFYNLGSAFLISGKSKQALTYRIKSFIIRNILFKYKHTDIAEAINGIAAVLFKMDVPSNAKSIVFFTEALKIRNEIFEEDHIDRVCSLINVGLAYFYHKNDNKIGLERIINAHKMLIKLFESDHPVTASVLLQFGIVYHQSGDFEKAKNFKEKSLKMRQSLYNKQNGNEFHYDLAESLNSLGITLDKLKKRDEAKECFKKSLDIQTELKRECVNMVISMYNTGTIYRDLKKVKKGHRFIEQGYEVRGSLMKLNAPGITLSLNKVPIVLGSKTKCW